MYQGERMKTKRTFIFDTVRDRDLLAALDRLPAGEKSRAVRDALRRHFQSSLPEPALADLLDRLDEIQTSLADLRRQDLATAGAGGARPADDAGEDAGDDPVLTAALRGLGL